MSEISGKVIDFLLPILNHEMVQAAEVFFLLLVHSQLKPLLSLLIISNGIPSV